MTEKADRVSKIELAKVLKSVRDASPDSETNQKIKELLLPDDQQEREKIENAINGLDVEDEFAVRCRLMETATHLIPLEGQPIIPSDDSRPDFLARFQPGCAIHNYTGNANNGFHCCIEVKSTKKKNRKLSGKKLRRLRKFSKEFNLPLFFAVKLNSTGDSVWTIIEDENRESSSINVGEEHLISGVRHVLWNEYTLTWMPDSSVVRVFDREATNDALAKSEYGGLRELVIKGESVELRFKDAMAAGISAILNEFDMKRLRVNREGNITTEVSSSGGKEALLADLVYKLSEISTDDKGTFPSRFIARVDKASGATLADRSLIEYLVKPLVENQMLTISAIGSPDRHLELWKRYSGNVTPE